MKKTTSANFIKEVLFALKEKQIPVTKIVLHKFVYFLMLQNHAKLFNFEPYTYGPFSFSLAKEVERLVFWDEVTLNGNNLNLTDIGLSDIDKASVATIKKDLDVFTEITDGKYSFDNLERIGTVLYCMEVLKDQEIEINIENVKEEFRGWKGNKYTDNSITQTFNKIQTHLPIALQ